MNNFNTIFSTVKEKCKTAGVISDNTQIKAIAEKAGVTEDQLYFYLDCLQEMQVIRFLPDDKSIAITDQGKRVVKVFPRQIFC